MYWKLLVASALVVGLGVVAWQAWDHYDQLLEDRETLKTNVATLEAALSVQAEANEQMLNRVDDFVVAMGKQRSAIESLTHQSAAIATQSRRMVDVLARHDVERLLTAKPALTLHRLNAGTAHVLRVLECSTAPGGCGDTGPPDSE